MTIRETTTVSWFGRLRRSVGGVLFGLLLVVAMVVLLFWNEGRAVTTARSLEEGAGIVISVGSGSVDPANEGRLVHVTGDVATGHVPSDPDFAVSAAGIRLDRIAEMFQWRETTSTETRTKLGGGEETVTTYSYSTGWERRAIDSSSFRNPSGHENPPMMIEGRSFQVPEATLGAFDLSQRVLGNIGGARTLPVPQDRLDEIQQAVGAGMRASVVDGRIFLGTNPQQPRVGDYRIGYELVPLGPVSVVGRQAGTGFEPYQTRAGRQLLMVDNGIKTAEVMFADAMSANTVLTWLVRIAGLVFLGVGFALILSPLGVIADVIPFLGSIVRMGAGVVAMVGAALVGSATIALAWLFYRPLTALFILALGAAVAYVVVRNGRRRSGASDVPPAAAPPGQPA